MDGISGMAEKTCNKCGMDGCEWDIELHDQRGYWRLKPHKKPNSDEWCIKPIGKKIINLSDSNNPEDINYVNPSPCITCSYHHRKCYSNQELGHQMRI